MFDKELKRYLKLGVLFLVLAALLGPYLGLHLISDSPRRKYQNSELEQPLPLHNPLPIPEGLKQLSHDHPTPAEGSSGKLSDIEDLLGSAKGDKLP